MEFSYNENLKNIEKSIIEVETKITVLKDLLNDSNSYQNELDKKIMCFCVGNLTEKKARSVGFQNTIAAEGNVLNLKELILQKNIENETITKNLETINEN